MKKDELIYYIYTFPFFKVIMDTSHSNNLHPCSCIEMSNNKIYIKIVPVGTDEKKHRKERRIISKNVNVVCVDGKLTSKTIVTTKFSNNHQQQSEKVQDKIAVFLQGECVEFFVFRYNLTEYYVSVESSPLFCKKQKKKIKKKKTIFLNIIA